MRALILLDTQAGPEDADVIPLYQGMVDAWVADGPTDELADASASLIIGDPELSSTWTAIWKSRPQESLRNPGQALLERESIADRLGEITVPALVVHGTADVSISMDKAEALAAGLVGCDGRGGHRRRHPRRQHDPSRTGQRGGAGLPGRPARLTVRHPVGRGDTAQPAGRRLGDRRCTTGVSDEATGRARWMAEKWTEPPSRGCS